MAAEWPGVIDTNVLKEPHLEAVNRLADAAKVGDWEEVLRLLAGNDRLNANQWRIGGDSWFAPLHQAAFLGASRDVVDALLDRGAWRSLRTASGKRPLDIAVDGGHEHLIDALTVREPSEAERRRFLAWDRELTGLISQRTDRLEPVRIRPVPTEIIALEPLQQLYFAYPGMYGGFSMSIFTHRLLVESSSRVVGGSGQAHVITESGCVLVEEGFV